MFFAVSYLDIILAFHLCLPWNPGEKALEGYPGNPYRWIPHSPDRQSSVSRLQSVCSGRISSMHVQHSWTPTSTMTMKGHLDSDWWLTSVFQHEACWHQYPSGLQLIRSEVSILKFWLCIFSLAWHSFVFSFDATWHLYFSHDIARFLKAFMRTRGWLLTRNFKPKQFMVCHLNR